MATQFEVFAEGFIWPEGPVVFPDGSVILVEYYGKRITRAWGDGKKETIATTTGSPNGLQLAPDGSLYLCNAGGENAGSGENGGEGRIERVDIATGRIERICDRFGDRLIQAPNDLVVDTGGNIWFTDLGAYYKETIGKSGIYWCRADGSEVRQGHYGGLGYNGIGLSPDGKTLFSSTTWSGRLYSFDLVSEGTLATDESTGRVSPRYIGSSAGDCGFDSLAMTASGAVCVATLNDGGITTFAPDGTRRFLPLPDKGVTNIAFGGPDMQDAYITLGRSGQLVKLRWDEPGLKLNFA